MIWQRRHRGAALLLCAAALPAWAAAPPSNTPALTDAAPPAAGLYDARLCVAVGKQPPDCGPVLVEMGDEGYALVRVADMRWHLQPMRGQLGVSLYQGDMQLDGFFANFQWSGTTLKFSDPDKPTHYEVQLGKRRLAP